MIQFIFAWWRTECPKCANERKREGYDDVRGMARVCVTNEKRKKRITFSPSNLVRRCCNQHNFIKFTPKRSNPNLERVLYLHHFPRNLYLNRPARDTLNRVIWPKESKQRLQSYVRYAIVQIDLITLTLSTPDAV